MWRSNRNPDPLTVGQFVRFDRVGGSVAHAAASRTVTNVVAVSPPRVCAIPVFASSTCRLSAPRGAVRSVRRSGGSGRANRMPFCFEASARVYRDLAAQRRESGRHCDPPGASSNSLPSSMKSTGSPSAVSADRVTTSVERRFGPSPATPRPGRIQARRRRPLRCRRTGLRRAFRC